ncbi:MAG: amidohydrolase, partial [Vicinamibacteria bacterium]
AAGSLVGDKIPKAGPDARYALLARALALLSSQGITSVQDASADAATFAAADLPLYERALKEGKWNIRMVASITMEPGQAEAAIAEARRLQSLRGADPLLRFGAVKGFVDGVIEAHTAAMLEPYSDDPSFGLGLPNWTPDALNAAVIAADKAGLQVYLHAIGDRGVRMALDAHEAALKAGGRPDRRGRIEHIETIEAADYPRFAALGVIASMQPLHANPDQNNFDVWSRNAGPDRASRGFSWRNIEKAGGRLVFGSDWPVVTSNVFRGLYCAVARKTPKGMPADGWLPELAVSLDSALRHYTIDGAYGAFAERDRGSLSVGKRADLVVLSEDLFKAPPETILKTQALLTVMDGRIVHRASAF